MSNYEERLKFWQEIQDNPRKMKVGHRAGLVAASAGKPDSMDRSSLESFQKELEEGVAALASITDPNVTPDANEKTVPLQAKLREVLFELEKRPADEKRVDTGQPNPPPAPPAEVASTESGHAAVFPVVNGQAIAGAPLDSATAVPISQLAQNEIDRGNTEPVAEVTAISGVRVGPGLKIRRRR